MRTADLLDRLVWVLLYGGIIVFGLGLAMAPASPALRWAMVIGGPVACAVAGLLLFVRSRLKDDA